MQCSINAVMALLGSFIARDIPVVYSFLGTYVFDDTKPKKVDDPGH